MIRSTPHPPEDSTRQPTQFSVNLGNLSLLTIKPGVKVEDALITASEYLACAAATAYESADNSTKEFRPLARSVMHQIEAARVLIEAAVEGLNRKEGPKSST
ncbi:MAG TPA: hypothetical protein VF682_05635 [Pseudomonas sp.]|jgi:hypothetical protein